MTYILLMLTLTAIHYITTVRVRRTGVRDWYPCRSADAVLLRRPHRIESEDHVCDVVTAVNAIIMETAQ